MNDQNKIVRLMSYNEPVPLSTLAGGIPEQISHFGYIATVQIPGKTWFETVIDYEFDNSRREVERKLRTRHDHDPKNVTIFINDIYQAN